VNDPRPKVLNPADPNADEDHEVYTDQERAADIDQLRQNIGTPVTTGATCSEQLDDLALGLDAAGVATSIAGTILEAAGAVVIIAEIPGIVVQGVGDALSLASTVVAGVQNSLPSCEGEFTGTIKTHANIIASQGISAMNGTINLGHPDGQQYTGGIALGGGSLLGAGYTGFDADLPVADDLFAIAIGIRAHAGAGNVAIGTDADATGLWATAIGNTAVTNGNYTTAIGGNAEATAAYASAFGSYSEASGLRSTAQGAYAEATAEDASASGAFAAATALRTTANGAYALANAVDASATGAYSDANGLRSTANGAGSLASHLEASAFGAYSVAIEDYTTALGAYSQATDQYASAYGRDSRATGEYSTAGGAGTRASGSYASVYGQGSQASGVGATAIGANSVSNWVNSTAIGADSEATMDYQQMFGTARNTYTMPGIVSATSTARQTGAKSLVTTDGNGNLAADQDLYNQIGQNREGVAMAMALGNFWVPESKKFAIGVNAATWDGTWAVGANIGGELGDGFYVTGGMALSESGLMGGRVGGVLAW